MPKTAVLKACSVTNDGCPISARFWQIWATRHPLEIRDLYRQPRFTQGFVRNAAELQNSWFDIANVGQPVRFT
jgi:hypothetical protein